MVGGQTPQLSIVRAPYETIEYHHSFSSCGGGLGPQTSSAVSNDSVLSSRNSTEEFSHRSHSQ